MRYRPEIEWSKLSWKKSITAYAFRGFEWAFGRKEGIRREAFASAHIDEDGRLITTYQFCSLEAICCHIEQVIRNAFAFRIRLPVRVWIPRLSPMGGLPSIESPFLFAIAYDTSNHVNTPSGTPETSITLSYTATGSNSLLLSGGLLISTGDGSHLVSTISWNGSNMTSQYNQETQGATTNRGISLYSYLNGTANGLAYNVVVTPVASTRMTFAVMSYSGVLQTGFPDSKVINVADTYPGSYSSISLNFTTVANNCWLAGIAGDPPVTTAGSNTTIRQNVSTDLNVASFDTNAAQTPAGAHSLTVNMSAVVYQFACGVSFAPAAGTTFPRTASVSVSNAASGLVIH